MTRRLLAWLLVFSAAAQAGAASTEVIPLAYRSLHEMLPVLQPLVSPGGSVTGVRDQLVVTGSPQQLARVRQVLAQLDRPPARLVISVRQEDSETRNRDSAAVQGQLGNLQFGGGGAQVGPSPDAGGQDVEIRAGVTSRKQMAEGQIVQRVQVLEGNEAYISSGELLGTQVASPYGQEAPAYYPVVRGFYVVPRVRGEQVQLQISSVSRRQAALEHGRFGGYARPQVATTGVTTQVAGQLGEWIAVAEVATEEQLRHSSIGGLGRHDSRQGQKIFLKVEKLPESQ